MNALRVRKSKSGHPGFALLVAALLICFSSCRDKGETESDELARLESLIKDGHYAEAQREGRGLLSRMEESQKGDSPELANTLDKLVEALWRGDQVGEETLALAMRAVSMRETLQGVEHPDTATSLNNLGSVFLIAGRYQEALSAYDRAYRIRQSSLGADHPDIAAVLNNLAQVDYVLGDYGRARANLEEALRILTIHYGKDHQRVGDLLDNLGRVLTRQGDPDQAAFYTRRSLEILEPALGAEHPTVLNARSGLALALRHQGNPEEAIPLLQSVAEAQARVLGEKHGKYLSTAENLGNAYAEAGDFVNAQKWRARIVEIREQAWPDHPLTGTAQYNYGRILYLQREFAEAKRRFEKSLELRSKWYGERHFTVAATLPYIAYAEFELGDERTALEHALEATEMAREQFQLVAASLSEKEALRLETIRRYGIDAALRILGESPLLEEREAIRRVWDQVVRSRALVLDDIARRKRVVAKSADPRTQAATDALAAARTELAKLLVASPSEDAETYQRQLHEAEERRARAERELAAVNVSSIEPSNRLGYDEVAGALPRAASLVAFARYGRFGPMAAGAPPVLEPVPHYFAFVLRGDRLAAHPLGPAEPIETAVKQWKRLVEERPSAVPLAARRAEADYAAAAQRLRALLWDPIREAIGDSDEAFVVADGAIHLVSFSTLVDDDGGYFAESGPAFHYLSTERDLVAKSQSAAADGRGLFALGGPDFGPPITVAATPAEGDCKGLAGLSFEALDPSRAEAEELAATWKARARGEDARSRVVTGAAATEQAVRTLAPGYRIVHLATHGFFAEDLCAPLKPAEPLSDVSERLAVRILRDPLILSGLALAGANSSRNGGHPPEEDGILTAEEVAALDLSGVEWIVLSACKTGLGEVQNGEGVLGLRRAFETAGARTLIMSLWAVDDEATRSWMKALYARRLAENTTMASVEAATRQTIEERRAAGRSTHPFYWGAFTAVGDWR